MQIRKWLPFVLACLLILIPIDSALSASVKKTKLDLRRVKREISTIQTSINHTRKKQNTQTHGLRKIEMAMAKATRQLHTTSKKIQRCTRQLQMLNNERLQDQFNISEQKRMLSRLIQAAYMIEPNNVLKVLFNQQHPSELSQLNGYLRFMNKSRIQLIGEIQQAVESLKQNEVSILQERQALTQLQLQQQQQAAVLQKQRKQRKHLVSTLNKRLKTKSQKLSQLLANKKNLEGILHKLYVMNSTMGSHVAFRKLRGKLQLPTRGKIQRAYNEQYKRKGLKLNGVFIKAPEGQDVVAVSAGKVVFADWIRGYGLLMIVTHNQHYMSLYGHNSNLYKQVGDTVKAGEVIAKVGQSGGNLSSGLYFELRHNGISLNPSGWFRRHA